MLLGIIILTPVAILSNKAFAQTLHNQTLYEIVEQTSGLDENSQIDVGDSPTAIDVNDITDTVYVANFDSDTMSIISALNNTKIGEDIPVGDRPVSIGVDEITDRVYIAHIDYDTVSAISGENNTKIGEDIPVGDAPIAVDVDENTDTVYVANIRSNTVSVISAENNTKIGEDIPVGNGPSAVGVNEEGFTLIGNISLDDISKDIPEDTDTVYVANADSDTVSVISAENNTKIKDIPVGDEPGAIGINGNYTVIEELSKDIPEDTDTVYVANIRSNTVSVISAENNTKIGEDIPVGDRPVGIGVNQVTDRVYVANSGSNTVSVISAENNTKIKDIPVGDSPSAVGVNEFLDTVYVANGGSDGISIIDGATNKVVAGITFQVNPFNSGYILCDGLTTPSPVGQYIYVYSGAQCVAKPNDGFEFASWEENLEGNSTQPIQVSRSASAWDSIAAFFGSKRDEPEAILNITKFGTFAANFKELPPAIPPEYWIPLYGIIASTIVGWSIPSIIGWTKSKRDVRKLNYYHKQIASLYQDGKLDENDMDALDQLRSRISNAYPEGQINEKHYESLRDEISTLYEEIFRKKIASLDSDNNSVIKRPVQKRLAQIRNEIKYAYSKRKINEKHYDLLNEDISKLDSNESNNPS